MMAREQTQDMAALSWQEANYAYLQAHLDRLRLVLRRRVLWLRQQWRHDALQNYQGLVISDAQADWLLAGEQQQSEVRFYAQEPAAVALGRSLVEMDREIGRQRRACTQAGAPPALDMVVHLFGLSPFERNVLLLCLAPELEPTFERLYAYVQDDVTRKYMTPQLAVTLCAGAGESWPGARASLLQEAPLRHFRLVTLGTSALPAVPSGSCPLRLEERLVGYLLGVNQLDARVAELLQPMPPALLAPSHSDLVTRLEQRIRADALGRTWPALNLIGPPHSGKRVMARTLCERLQLHLYSLNVTRLPVSGPERQEVWRLLEREAMLLQFALYVDLTQAEETAEGQVRASVSEAIESLGLFLLLGSLQRWPTTRETVEVQMPRPDAGTRRAWWQQALAGVPHDISGEVEALVQQFDFGPAAISQAVAAAQSQLRLHQCKAAVHLQAPDVWQACRVQAAWRLEDMAQRLMPHYNWEDIILAEDVYRQLQEIADQVAYRAQVYETWGFGAKLSRGRGISALFAGPSGTGKTMAAEVLASHLQLDLYRIDLAGVVSKYIGETEKNLRRVFDAAERSGAILFFDEADALFGKRSEVKDSHDRYANIEIDYLLQRMEDYRGLAILATNMKSLLDQAFLRRLRFLVDFPFPDAALRLRIWQRVFPPQVALDGLDYTLLARLEIPGGNIKNIALNAAFLAAAARQPLRTEHVLHAARREYAKIDKLMPQSEFGSHYAAGKR